MVCYELDNTIKPIVTFNANQHVVYGDFTKQSITQKFKTILGNPPYVKQSSGNLYIQFIDQCYQCLEDDGELIFIVPSDFIKLTSAAKLINTMVANGSFTDFFFPHDENLFENASIDVIVFRYQKGRISNETHVNGKPKICNVQNGIITFSETAVVGRPLSELFNVYVGLVSGRDEVYRIPIGNLDILIDKNRTDKFIFCKSFPTEDAAINTQLTANKAVLLERRIRKFDEKNWFEWGAPRNLKSIEDNLGKPCIYVRNMTRQSEVAFISQVQHFGGTLLCLIPKESMNQDKLLKIIALLNSKVFQSDYMYSGRFKIGHKQMSNVIVPTE